MELKHLLLYISKSRLGSEAIRVLLYLSVLTESPVSNKTLSKETGIMPSGVSRAISNLKKNGVISVSKKSTFGQYSIRINHPKNWGLKKAHVK